MARVCFSSACVYILYRLCLSRAVGKTGFQLVMTLLQLFLISFARVSSVSELTGSVAKKSCNKKTQNWKTPLKNWTFGRIFLRK